jgi:CheY-like chemotaxis protein
MQYELGGKMSLSILLVDDNDVNLKVASLMIKKLGHHADLATNGIEAIEAIEHQLYDVVLMDIQMPVMDGIEATKIIRQRWHHDLKIIIVTSLDNYREICLEAGADDFLTKPLRLENLRKTIRCDMSIPYFGKFVSSGIVENATTCDL